MDNFGTTICGYQINDLVLFANACRSSGITENELHDFVLNYEYAYKLGLSCANSILIEKVSDIVKDETRSHSFSEKDSPSDRNSSDRTT